MKNRALGTVRRGRRARRSIRQTPDIEMLPALKRNIPLTEPMDEEQIQRIDQASMHILEDIGVHFRDPIAIADWKATGAKVVNETVFLDRGLVNAAVTHMEFNLCAV